VPSYAIISPYEPSQITALPSIANSSLYSICSCRPSHQAKNSRCGELSALSALSAVFAERNMLAACSTALVSRLGVTFRVSELSAKVLDVPSHRAIAGGGAIAGGRAPPAGRRDAIQADPAAAPPPSRRRTGSGRRLSSGSRVLAAALQARRQRSLQRSNSSALQGCTQAGLPWREGQSDAARC
jgi:hypothetical protein